MAENLNPGCSYLITAVACLNFTTQVTLFQVYLGLLLLYTILMPLQMYASKKQNHAISRLLAAGLTTQFAALFLICIHYSLFAANGAGIAIFAVVGEVLEIISDSLFMLLLLLLAMGW